ncbi:MAG: hypothetical protein RSB38_07970 [Oscillospiraceae bacterium]
MKNELLLAILQSLNMGFAFLIPLILCRVADITFGVVASFKLENLKFDWKKLLSSIFATFVTLIGLACLLSGITMIPELLKYYNIELVDAEALQGVIDVAVIVGTFTVAAYTYGKDAFNKLKTIIQPVQK